MRFGPLRAYQASRIGPGRTSVNTRRVGHYFIAQGMGTSGREAHVIGKCTTHRTD